MERVAGGLSFRRGFVGFVLSFALVAAAGMEPLVYGEKDDYGVVSKASQFRLDGKIAEGEAYVAEQRARPREGLSPAQLQAEDMAEFALYRLDAAYRNRCIQLLRKVHATGPTTIWGWAAYGYLQEFGVTDVEKPMLDPRFHLGEIADGVLDFNPKTLTSGPSPAKSGCAAALLKAEASKIPLKVPSAEDLEPGCPLRQSILRTRLIELCGAENVDRILSQEGGEKLFSRLWDDIETLEAFLLSGPVFDPKLALETLMTLFLNDENGWTQTELGRKIAVATALNACDMRHGKDKKYDFLELMRCYAATRRLAERGLLHESAMKRDTREWRFIVRYPTNPVDILYLNSRPFPYEKPGSAIHTIPYRTRNCFGEHHLSKTRQYYTPWRYSDWPMWYRNHRVGGICNRQSTYGAVLANAHGLMAERAGQPNHCAWLLRDEKGLWNIHNDINKYTRGVFLFWGSGYQYIQAVERAFADRKGHDHSELFRFLAAHFALSSGDAAFVDKFDRMAISACPYSYDAWRDYTDRLKKGKASPEAWLKYIETLVRTAPEGRTVSWDFGFEALKAMREAGANDDKVFEGLLTLVDGLPEPEKAIAEEMDFYGVVLNPVKKLFPKDTERMQKFLVDVLEANWNKGRYMSDVLRFAVETFKNDNETCAKFFAAFENLGSQRTPLSGKGIDFRRLILAASRAGQRDTFRTFADIRNHLSPPPKGNKMPERDFGGARIVSERALLTTSGPVRGNRAEDYPRVTDLTPLDPKTKFLFKAGGKESYATVEMPGNVKIAGVALMGTVKSPVVSISEDGKTWTEIHREAGSVEDLRVTGATPRPMAKYVRVTGAVGEPLALKKILVYGEPLY